jgi:hypothetical protein
VDGEKKDIGMGIVCRELSWPTSRRLPHEGCPIVK